MPGIGQQVNGAYLGVGIGSVSFQPAEFAKIGIIIFLASYLRDTRQLLVQRARSVLGVTIPPLKHLGPLLVVWGAAMLFLFFIRDIGSSLMFFGGFLALLYVATNRLLFPVVGLAMFSFGAWFSPPGRPTSSDRVDAWLHPFDKLYDEPGGSYQVAQSLFAQADGGLFGKGFGQAHSCDHGPAATLPLLPAAQTDLIYAVIVNELGLVGAAAVICVYLLVVERGFKTATLAGRLVLQAARRGADGGLRAAGLRHRRRRDEAHPADRRDAAVRLLRRLVDPRELRPAGAAADGLRPRARGSTCAVNAPIARLFVVVLLLFAALVAKTSYNAVFGAEDLQANTRNQREVLAQQKIRRGTIRAADGTRARPVAQAPRRDVHAPVPRRRAVRPRGRLQLRPLRALGAGEAVRQGAGGRPRRVRRRCWTRCSRRRPTATTCARRSTRRRSARRSPGLAGRKGAVVALDPRTGAVKAFASDPASTPAPCPTGASSAA